MKVLYWHRNDLRFLDNEILSTISQNNDTVLPVYIFNLTDFKMLELGFRKTGIHRFRYIIDTLKVLRGKYKQSGGDMVIRVGDPSSIIKDLVELHKIEKVIVQKELAYEEVREEEKVEKVAKELGCEFRKVWGRTLYHIDDIPYDRETFPLTSKTFRINTTKATEPRALFPVPEKLRFITNENEFGLPAAEDVGFTSEEEVMPRQDIYQAGEDEALKRLSYYSFESELLTSYKWTRNRSLGMDYSSKLSPFLAIGAISPRVIYWKVKEYEKEIKRNISTWWLVFEVVWRDYFCFSAWKHGNKMFFEGGIKDREVEWNNNRELFERWKIGQTGIPFLDAHMKELDTTGFMSNRGRVNSASFLSRDYKVDWRWGAAWFENRLIDYDVYSNWLNWNMQAMEIWYTNPVHQAMKYDKKGEYTLKWNPDLEKLPTPTFHAPWKYSKEQLESYGVTDYQRPVEIYSKWTRSINNIWKE